MKHKTDLNKATSPQSLSITHATSYGQAFIDPRLYVEKQKELKSQLLNDEANAAEDEGDKKSASSDDNTSQLGKELR